MRQQDLEQKPELRQMFPSFMSDDQSDSDLVKSKVRSYVYCRHPIGGKLSDRIYIRPSNFIRPMSFAPCHPMSSRCLCEINCMSVALQVVWVTTGRIVAVVQNFQCGRINVGCKEVREPMSAIAPKTTISFMGKPFPRPALIRRFFLNEFPKAPKDLRSWGGQFTMWLSHDLKLILSVCGQSRRGALNTRRLACIIA